MNAGRLEIKQRVSKPLTDGDLERLIGIKSDDILKYSDLSGYAKIEDLLPSDNSFRIFLIEDKYNSGHWVCVMRYGDTIEYFNSYGCKWDTDWRFINKMIRVILGENTNEMTRLMDQAKKDGWKTVWNKHRFQKLDNKVQTCGRWCVMRIELMKMGYNLPEFYDFIKHQEKALKEKSDFVVAKYVA